MCAVRLCLQMTSEAMPGESRQCDCPNIRCTRGTKAHAILGVEKSRSVLVMVLIIATESESEQLTKPYTDIHIYKKEGDT